jgi:hypothetical protein
MNWLRTISNAGTGIRSNEPLGTNIKFGDVIQITLTLFMIL